MQRCKVTGTGNPPPRSVQRNDDLIMMDDPKLPPDQFVAEIRINTAGIEKINPISQFTPLSLDLLQLHLSVVQLAGIIPPGEDTIGTQYHVASEEKQKEHGDRWTKSRK